MSLVERALQKIQASDRARKAVAPVPPTPVGRLVPAVAEQSDAVTPFPVDPSKIVRVDRDALRATGLLAPAHQEREIADQYRAIKRPLIQKAFFSPSEDGPSQRLIMVASALPGDGKTFTAVNLALSMAREKDYSVILMDGDVVKPHVSKLFGVGDEPGLLGLLTNPDMDVRSAILPTDIPHLSILPAGSPIETATELLASERMATVMNQLALLNPRGLVVCDSLPVLLTSEARVLSTLMGQIVLVVKAGTTPQQAVRDALELLGPERDISLILNHAEVSGPLGYYYGYGYGYRNYGETDGSASSAAASAGKPTGVS